MKAILHHFATLLFLSFLWTSALVSAQSTTSRLQPNPNAQADIELVSTFLHHLANVKMEAAHQLMADDFKAIGPGFPDKKDGSQLLTAVDNNQKFFTEQQYIFQDSASVVCLDGADAGVWVYHQGIWNARDNLNENLWPMSTAFHHLAKVKDGKIVETRTTYANDQIFYNLGFPVYKNIIQPVTAKNK